MDPYNTTSFKIHQNGMIKDEESEFRKMRKI